MKRSHVTLLAAGASLGLLLILLSTVAGRFNPTLAAPRSDHVFSDPLSEGCLPLYQTINCTLATTTTDSLEEAGIYNDDYASAVTLSNYTGLALSPGDLVDVTAPAKDDWFRLDNAETDSIYEVKAVPDRTSNYNLGIIVYDASLTPIITDTNTANYYAEVTLVADGYGPYFFKVFQISQQCTGETYHLDFSIVEPTPTSTPSAPSSPDAYEPNDNFDEAYELPVVTSVSLSGLEGLANFYPVGDENWFKFWTKAGFWYQATTSELSGVDTYMEIRDRNNAVVESDDDGGGGYASQAQWDAGYNGYYYIRITNKVETTGEYNLTVGEIGAPATSTPGPSPTPGPGPDAKADSCEDNLDFTHACIIAADQSQTFNFVPPHGGVDNDYYMIWVKPGLIYDCATSNLDPGVDTNMILYDSNRNGIGGNDDVEPGNPASAFSYYATYDGWLYLLVGVGDRTPSDIYNSNYTLRCDRRVPGQPTTTPTPEKAKPTNTPGPTTTPGPPTAGPTPTPAPSEGLTVRPLTTPTPVPAMTPAPQFVPISLLVYYDANDDRQPGAGEGVAGVSAQAYEAATNQLLAQGFTDDQGSLEFTVAAQGPVRVSVPFFGFSQLVTGDGASIYVRVSSQPLPEESP